MSLTWPAVLAWRTARQHLAPRATDGDALAVVADLAGLHAQVMPSAELSLAARTEDPRRDALPRALWEDRTLVKTWAMRGTLHVLPARELGLWTGALAVLEERQRAPGVLNRIGVTRAQCDAITAAIPEALDGRALTREALAAEVGRLAGQGALRDAILGQYGDQLLKPAAFRGDLCFAPNEGARVRFTRPQSWLSRHGDGVGDPEAAARELARRWLRAYGPSTPSELGRWTGTTAAQGKAWLAALGDEVAEVDVEGERLVMLARDVDAAATAEPAGAVRLLPAYDAFTAGTAKSAPAVIADDKRGEVWQSAGRLAPVVVADGRIVGTWRHAREAGRLAIRVAPFEDLPRAGVEADAARIAEFLGGELELAVS